MTNEQQQPSYEDLLRTVRRDHFVKQQLSSRVASLVQENLELAAMFQDQQEQTPPSHDHSDHTHSNGDVEEQPRIFAGG